MSQSARQKPDFCSNCDRDTRRSTHIYYIEGTSIGCCSLLCHNELKADRRNKEAQRIIPLFGYVRSVPENAWVSRHFTRYQQDEQVT